MRSFDVNSSLQRLLKMVPPPADPLEVERKPAPFVFAGGQPGAFPPDYLAFTEKYGSGEFWQDGDVGMIASIHNPRAAAYQAFFDKEHEFLLEYKLDEGDGYAAYDIHPVTPGLLQWGWAQGRKRISGSLRALRHSGH